MYNKMNTDVDNQLPIKEKIRVNWIMIRLEVSEDTYTICTYMEFINIHCRS